MATIEALIKDDIWWEDSLLAKNPRAIQAKLEEMGYHNFALESGDGSNAYVIKPTDNDDIVFVLREIKEGDRRKDVRIPQMLQAIHTEKVGDYEIEILPKLNIDGVEERHVKDFIVEVEQAYKGEGTHRGGYEADEDTALGNIGLFTYRDAANRIQTAPMAVDPSAIKKRESVEGAGDSGSYRVDYNPRATKSYPSLEDQRKVQQRIIDKDKRLQQLTGGVALPQPETMVIGGEHTSHREVI